jgi:hypothetical protein
MMSDNFTNFVIMNLESAKKLILYYNNTINMNALLNNNNTINMNAGRI